MTDNPMTPDRARTDALQPGDKVWHPYDWTLITISCAPKELEVNLGFHTPGSTEWESGMRVTATDDKGETAYVDAAQSYLWHREAQAATAPLTPDEELSHEELPEQDHATYTAAQAVAAIVSAGKESERLHQRQLAAESAPSGVARINATAAADAEATHWKRLGITPPGETQ